MFVPFVFTLDTLERTGNFFHWAQFYMYANACIREKWPIIAHERYFERLSHVEETVFGISVRAVLSDFCISSVPTTAEMLALKAYPISQVNEDALIAKYASQFDCWVDLLKNDNAELEEIIGELLDRIISDIDEKFEGILIYEYLPKALLKAANKRGIPVYFQAGGIVRLPFAKALNACSIINTNDAEAVKAKYDDFLSKSQSIPMLSRKGLLRLFVSEQYMADVHNIDNEPEYDVGVLYNNVPVGHYYIHEKYMSDYELSARAKAKYDKVLIRTRPGFEPTADALDDSPSCFHFCCKCKHVLGFVTKGVFEAMLAGRIPHEYGAFIFHSFCNNGIEDDSKGVAPIELLNYIMFGLCTPFPWLTNPDYLRFLLTNPSEEKKYMRSFNYYTRGISQEDLELYYMSDNRSYRLGDTLYFTSGHKPHEYAAYYCIGGLHNNGGVCTWSNAESTSFRFDLTQVVNEPLTISVVLYDAAIDWSLPSPKQTVACNVNGADCGYNILTPGKNYLRFTVPMECFSDKLHVTFSYSHLQLESGISFAVAFERMYISFAGQRAIEDAMAIELAAMVDRISELDARTAGLHAQVQELDAKKSEQQAYISRLEARNAEQSAHISGLVSQFVEQNAQISGLIAHVSEQSARISEMEIRNSEQKEQITGLEAQSAEQKEQISGLEAQNTEQKEHISGLEAQIKAIYGSRSWKYGNGIMNIGAKVLKLKK